jgi:Zn-dependent peptidase ImmA (M78 family)
MSMSVTSDLADQEAEQEAIRPQLQAWSLARLEAACVQKRIHFRESPSMSVHHGIAARRGETVTISIQAALPEPLKVAALAHELGHIYLGHTRSPETGYRRAFRGMTLSIVQDANKEQAADIWAAHLLVYPEVFQWNWELALELPVVWDEVGVSDSGVVLALAIARTSQVLNIPPEMVALWWRTREIVFPEAPRDWLEHTRREALLSDSSDGE